MTNTSRLSLAIGLVLVIAVGLVAFGEYLPRRPTFHGSIAAMVAATPVLPGWTREFAPLAETREMQTAMNELLNYDDATYAIFRNGDLHISVYVAYWTPGKMSYRLVAGHTPDVCWPANGWTNASSHLLEGERAGSRRLLPVEDSVFLNNGQTEHVWFWHLVDGSVRSYATRGSPPWYATISDLLKHGFAQRPEQFFVRVSSNRPISAELLSSLAPSVCRLVSL